MPTTRSGSLLAALLLSACVPGSGCITYGIQRAEMPPLGMDALSKWVAVTDTAMTEDCGK